MRTGILLIFLFFFKTSPGVTQTLDPKITESRLSINGVSRKGFSTGFDQQAKVIQKSWWKYAREFGRPLNMKTYYQVTIPSTENSGNVDLELLSKTMVKGKGSAFFLSIADEQLPDNRKTAYLEQVKLILQDFKKYHYISLLEDRIQQQEQRAKKVSKQAEKDPAKMVELMQEAARLEQLRNQLEEVYLTWH